MSTVAPNTGPDYPRKRGTFHELFSDAPQSRAALGCWSYIQDVLPSPLAHFQALATICSSERFAFQFSSFSARDGSATSSAGSPARRAPIWVGTLCPVTLSTVATTSCTE